jgi:hypothetical protein
MNLSKKSLMVLVLALAACGPEDIMDEGAQLLVPVEVEFPWNEAYNEADDGRAALVPLDVMVYDGVTGEPVFADLVLRAENAEFILPEQVVDAQPGSDARVCTDCIWDVYRDEFVAQPLQDPDAPLTLVTDSDGMARVFVVVDEVPLRDGNFDDITVAVVLGSQEELVGLVPR